jgi:hypothetical protein
MLRQLRLKRGGEARQPEMLSPAILTRDPTLPIALRSLNELPEQTKQRLYRALLPPSLLVNFDIHPITWLGPAKKPLVELGAEAGSGVVSLTARSQEQGDPFMVIELSDNAFNSIDLNLIVLSDPASERFDTDVDEEGNPTLYGTVRRNRAEEERAMRAGLAPGQIRSGLQGSRLVFPILESFLVTLGQRALYLEPLTYVSAWLFERRGFAYVSGHRLMEQIHQEFQPGGRLNNALDDSSPFRQRSFGRTVRGRAWAIHDGILAAIDANWDGLRMVKQVGREADVVTFPDAEY